MGGSLGRREATGRGCTIVSKEALKHLGMEVKGCTVAVQGFGNVGSTAAMLLEREGCKIVAIGDKDASFYNKDGINIMEAIAYVQKNRSLKGYTGGDAIGSDELLTLEVDLLIPAALENVITRKNAPKLRAKVVCEGANGPTTAIADGILDEKGVFVIPDILANAGGVTVSYFEWVQDRGGYFWDEETVNERLTKIMCDSFHAVLDLSQKHNVNMRTAAYMLAVSRVATVHRLRGIYS
jgi:glutamate dehydrogenase (NAD(P)+)